MHASFNSWKKSFPEPENTGLEDALSALETEFVQPPSLTRLPEDITDLAAPKPEAVAPDKQPEAPWESLVEAVSDRVIRRLEPSEKTAAEPSESSPVEEQMAQLLRDNRVLAGQIRALLAENDRLQVELECRDVQLARFRRVVGRWYLLGN